ncbi:GNAT family N-acetyltransferase [Pseudalkalibacillus hwajinpoensis]|uniref:GNAT family N-acetyltransferase n=1 Tax=Guptibacillus hwajinpoensis TaxID=208199 RepID=A0A4U1MHM4_9BACL|nr:GNAT family N-acetyltransferase [Pseudalkalibacillus hwajinpoensis]TKD69985.1 GNAT family N-acetyltransferase [Pseudalkalibacillus hwajinpoensis]
MKTIENPSIKLKFSLDRADYEDIVILRECCLEKENITLKLELDYKLSKSLNESIGKDKINEFMFYDGRKLIGYMGICQFGSETIEVNGMVHPEFREMGVFRRLFSLVKDEWNKRESQHMLLLSDRKSTSGIEFIKSTGAHYENSEYEMFLIGEARGATALKNLNLRKALNRDAKEIARQNAIYFQVNSSEEDLTLPEEESKHGMDTFLAEINQTIIGKVHMEVQNGVGGIYGLGVLPEYRGKGYGRDILMKAVEKLKEKQVQQIMLQVAVKNSNALNLYQSCGFKETSTMDYFKLTKNSFTY